MLEHKGLLHLLSVLDSHLQALEINVILTLNYCNFNSGAPETFVSVVKPFYCSVIANKYGLPRLGKLGREFCFHDLAHENSYSSSVSHGGRKFPAYALYCTSLVSPIR